MELEILSKPDNKTANINVKPDASMTELIPRIQASARITWPLTLPLTLSTPWMQAYLETIVGKFGGDPAICVREEAICAKVFWRTDRQTDDGRLAIALAHSWNELKKAMIYELDCCATLRYVTLRYVCSPQKLVIVKKTSTTNSAATPASPGPSCIEHNKAALSTQSYRLLEFFF